MIKLRTSSGKGFGIPVSKRSLEVAQVCARTWVPVVPNLMSSLQQRIKGGEFHGRESRLYRALRLDIGLYLHTFFHLSSDRDPLAPSTPENILGCVEKSSVWDLGNLIAGAPADFGVAEIREVGEFQARFIRFVLVASRSALLMAERAGIDEGMTFSLSLLRNIGTLLISWSFPAVFNRAMENTNQGLGNLTQNIEKSLNASVLEVGFLVIRGLDLGDKNCSIILNPGDIVPERGNYSNDESGRLRLSPLEKAIRFCEIGEALARLSDSESYPLSAKEWEYVNAEVMYYLGKNCIEQINESVAAASAPYLEYQPEVFSQKLNPERAVSLAIKAYNIHRFNRATQGVSLGESIRDIFESVYRLMAFEKASRSALDVLFYDVLPDMDFESGGLFIYDPKRDILTPKSSYGKDDWPIQPVSVSTPGDLPRLIYESRTSVAPLRLDKIYSNTVTRSYISWKFGNKELEGVIFLAYGRALRTLPARTVLTYFSLVRQAASDALFVGNDTPVPL